MPLVYSSLKVFLCPSSIRCVFPFCTEHLASWTQLDDLFRFRYFSLAAGRRPGSLRPWNDAEAVRGRDQGDTRGKHVRSCPLRLRLPPHLPHRLSVPPSDSTSSFVESRQRRHPWEACPAQLSSPTRLPPHCSHSLNVPCEPK